MGGEVLKVGNLKCQKNFVPLPYRRVSYQPYEGAMTEAAIREHLLAREVYRRTDVVVLHKAEHELAVAAVQRAGSEALFARVEAVEVLALPADCVFIRSSETDPANRSALAKLAREHRVGSDRTAVVQGAFDHINIIHRPDPLVLRVVEVAPPDPPKLYKMAEHVLSYADLPPICLELERIDLRELCARVRPEAYLVPCRSGGLDDLGARADRLQVGLVGRAHLDVHAAPLDLRDQLAGGEAVDLDGVHQPLLRDGLLRLRRGRAREEERRARGRERDE